MALLIDGYNLMHAAGFIAARTGPGGLERSRRALLNFLAASIDPAEKGRTTVVFDAAASPADGHDTLDYAGLCIRFATAHEDADALIEELIRLDSAPQKLTVVSSDHRLHRAARRRRAQAMDSEAWFEQVQQERRRRHTESPPEPARPDPKDVDVDYWLRQFDLLDEDPLSAEQLFPPDYGDDLFGNGLHDDEKSP